MAALTERQKVRIQTAATLLASTVNVAREDAHLGLALDMAERLIALDEQREAEIRRTAAFAKSPAAA